MTNTVGCLQPTYIPWIPFFKRFLTCDYFVLLDDVDYSKHKFQNRTYIKLNNAKNLLTVPVHYKMKVPINKIKIDNAKNWKKKHYQTIVQAYSKSRFFSDFQLDFEKIYQIEWDSLFKLNLEILNFFKTYFNIQKEIYISSQLNIIGDGNEKLVNICKYFDAKYFVVKKGTEGYHPKEYFQNNGIDFKYHENSSLEYNQIGNNFMSNLSILDYAANNGKKLIF
mgnify:CR=1 FL=1|tara:strand:- start:102 stop:770 length:669 start_codon:yes stop_codon:yes gene_type:complete